MRFYVLFASSFRCESAPNISHETVDKRRTMCGRNVSDAATFEPDDNDLDPDCIPCRNKARKLEAAAAEPAVEEAQVKCATCGPGHTPGVIYPRCFVTGCECWCNR